jgi:hypothetical protein
MKMRCYTKYFLGLAGVAMLTLPAWASTNHKDSMSLDLNEETTVGQAQLMPGHYNVKATESESTFELIKDGKVVATVPCRWVRLDTKPESSEIQSTNNHVTEFKFAGRTEALQVGS